MAPGGAQPRRANWELDVRNIRHNLLATLNRRPERITGSPGRRQPTGRPGGQHPRPGRVQAAESRRITSYDDHPRKSLIDLFYDTDATLEAVASGTGGRSAAISSAGDYEARIRRNPDRIQVQLLREGTALASPLRITKGLTLDAGSSTLQVAYLLENLPPDRQLHFAVEMNFAGMPSNAEGRYFRDIDGNSLGQLGAKLDLERLGPGAHRRVAGLDVGLKMSRPTDFWTFPIETVSQSEGGFELVHQSVVVMPHWLVEADKEGRWSVTMQLAIDTSLAERRLEEAVAAAAG